MADENGNPMSPKAGLIAEHLGTLIVVSIAALAAGAGKTWLDTKVNTGDIATMNREHDTAISDRYTATDAQLRSDDVNRQLLDLQDRIAQLEGRHAGH